MKTLFKNNIVRNKTFTHELIEFQELETITENGKRFYATPNGNYPSVTTVLSSLDKGWLESWKKRVGEEEANRISARASNRGTQFHSICEKYIMNEEEFCTNQPPFIEDMFTSIQQYIDHIDIIYGSETPVYSDVLKTAGRMDLFCGIRGERYILDFKTSSRKKKESDIKNYFLQCTAYSMMIKELTGIEVPKMIILMAVEDDNPLIFVKKTEPYEEEVRRIFNNYHITK
jgi:genome maintenance exonuclease 1